MVAEQRLRARIDELKEYRRNGAWFSNERPGVHPIIVHPT
jgi:hypothetical protein